MNNIMAQNRRLIIDDLKNKAVSWYANYKYNQAKDKVASYIPGAQPERRNQLGFFSSILSSFIIFGMTGLLTLTL